MAKDFMAIPATSSPSERAFSLAKNVITDNRNRLSPDSVTAIMCLQDWFQQTDFFGNPDII